MNTDRFDTANGGISRQRTYGDITVKVYNNGKVVVINNRDGGMCVSPATSSRINIEQECRRRAVAQADITALVTFCGAT